MRSLPCPAELVVRTRLLEMIDRGVRGPLTVVTAPAGTGKTVAVATWAAAERAPGPVAWLEVGDTGVAARELWPALVEQLRQSGVRVEQPLLDDSGVPNRFAIAELGAEIAGHRRPVTLVLDCNVDLPVNPSDALDQLLAAAVGRLHLVVLSRADPLLPIPRYRLSRSVVEIRTAELAFTSDEAGELLLRRGIELPADVVELLNQRTQGWAAGLLLAAMSLSDSSHPVLSARELSGATGPIAEYLVAEVLNRQPPVMREILLRTSVVDVLRPGLIEALVGIRGRRALAVMSRGNAFLDEVAAMPGWYRYHPLFRELLSEQLNFEAPAESVRLRLAAAQWYAENDLLNDAVRMAAAVGAWDAAAHYVIDGLAVVNVTGGDTQSPYRQAFARLPDAVESVDVSLLRAATAFARGEFDICGVQLRAAQEGMETAVAQSPGATALALSALRVLHASKGPSPDVILRAAVDTEQLMADFPAERITAHPELSDAVSGAKATALLALGRFDEAIDTYERMTRDGSRPGGEEQYVASLGQLALLAAWRGEMRSAVHFAHQALATSDSVRRREVFASVEVALGWVYSETQDLVRAKRHLKDATAQGAENAADFVRVALALVRARVYRTDGDFVAARNVLQRAVGDATRRAAPRWLLDRLAVEEANRPPQPQPLSLLPRRAGSDREFATRLARRSLDPQRPLHSADNTVAITSAASQHRWLRSDPATAAAQVLVEPLTTKEREVLGYLAELLTTDEIASEMYVSVNTIRSHVRNILRKLSASRRNEAIRRARTLGILAAS